MLVRWAGCVSIHAFLTSQSKIAEMNYTHLTQEERYQIYALKKAGHNQNEIANVLERSESTISRELARNRSGCGVTSCRSRLFPKEDIHSCPCIQVRCCIAKARFNIVFRLSVVR